MFKHLLIFLYLYQKSTIKINANTGFPCHSIDIQNHNKLTPDNLKLFETQYSKHQNSTSFDDINSTKSISTFINHRSKHETSEEKKERKKSYKNYRKVKLFL